MIRQLLRIVAPEDLGRFQRYLATLTLYGILQGVGVVLIVPVLRPLLRGDTDATHPWPALLAGVTVLTCAAYYVQAMLGFTSALALLRGLHHRVGDHVTALPLGWFSADRVGRLAQSTSQGTVMITGVPAHLLQPLVTSVVTPVTVAVGMLFFDWRLALATVVLTPVLALVYRWANALIAKSAHAVDASAVESSSRMVEFAQAQPVLRAFGRTAEGHRLLDDSLVDQRRAAVRMVRSGVPGAAGFALAVQAAFTVIVVVGVTLALDGDVDVAELIALLVLATRFTGPLIEVADLGAALRLAAHDIDRIDEVLAVPPLPEPAAPRSPADAGIGTEIVFDHVDFGYDDRRVLRDVSFTVPPRTMTALVGPSGSGKTTITRLIARFWDVDGGSVRVGGVDVRDMSTSDLMSRLSLVFQDVYLFDDTIEANIRVGRPDATDADVRHAARLARVDEIVARLPAGWQTRVGERGASLSGGERQPVSIARALLKDAPVVLLDEATAALDPENEAVVQDALRALTADRTLIVIAHRLRTVVAADRIVVLDEGAVVQSGTHDELAGQPGRYADFWAERERARGWRLAAPAPGHTPQ
ncbi:ABC transporter ATP-binding protein/permease (plasmid) [Embleya sp. NBC_00888]|uniref:ABC transporter ATP-binding protein n=1 Tax=Embleya sp. NBC_00888 TaxID=2975960 RepID=UPI002F917E9A|nr:ABC transporter ATP-binding protein/permease [Embleya sp. NBC_00888]